VKVSDEPIVQAIMKAFPGARLLTQREKMMIDPEDHEIEAIGAAGQDAGDYLEWLGKTDLATMSEDEWLQFIEVVVTGYQDKLTEIHARPVHEPETAVA
jgi:hypothetical protein